MHRSPLLSLSLILFLLSGCAMNTPPNEAAHSTDKSHALPTSPSSTSSSSPSSATPASAPTSAGQPAPAPPSAPAPTTQPTPAPAAQATPAPPQWTFHVEPAVEGSSPAVSAATDGPTQTITFRVNRLDASAAPANLLDARAFPDAKEVRYVLPVVESDTYATLQATGDAPAAEPLFVWNLLLRPRGRSIIDYAGREELLPPADFDAYWARARRELDAVPLAARVSRVPEKDTPTGLLHRVELPAVRDTTIVCWYYVPREAFDADGRVVKKYPANVIMPGYGAEEPPIDRTDKGLITLSINPRHHGPSKEFWKSPVEHMTYNLEDPENYYYKLAYLDCLRGAQFVFSRDEVDTAHVAAEGGSQGGLFALALAALEPRIACVCSNVTAFSDYPDGMMLARIGHHTSFRKRLAEASPAEAEKIRLSLQYTDGANMATRVRCPVQINMGGQDPVCPYPCGAVVYNRLPEGVEKEYHVVPGAKHEVPPPMRENNMRWYRAWLGIH